MIRIFFLGLSVFSSAVCLGEVSLNPLFSDGMVLQRDVPIAIWGTGTPDEKVAVSFQNDKQTGTVGADGNWKLSLKSKKFSSNPAILRVESEGRTIDTADVLVGDVWLCSGQSNMGFKLAKCVDGETVATTASDPWLRVNNYRGAWEPCVGEVASETSGVAYFFGRKLRAKNPDVPVGLIVRALSGSPIEVWTPVEALMDIAFSREMMERFHSGSDEAKRWLAYADAESERKRKERNEGRAAAGKRPRFSGDSETKALTEIYSGDNPGRLWRERITPIVGYALAGVIWYQGERNTKAGNAAASSYDELLAGLITSWRAAWALGDFRFLAVQLPTFSKGGPNWAIVQQGQVAAAEKTINTDYVSITDLPDGGLHPSNKQPVGERLADKAAP